MRVPNHPISSFLNTVATRIGRTRVRHDLLRRSDRFLADTGFSRELLEQGNDAWPWRAEPTTPVGGARHVVSPSESSRPVASAPVPHVEPLAAGTADEALVDGAVPSPGNTRSTDTRRAA